MTQWALAPLEGGGNRERLTLARGARATPRKPTLLPKSSILHLMDANGLLASLFISSIGLVTFLYGKKQGRLPQLVIGFVLIVYTYFLSSIAWMFAIAAALLALLWLLVRFGW
jgi:hypothetical protein